MQQILMFQRFKWSVAIAKANKPLNLCFAFSCSGYSSLSLFLFVCFSLCSSCIRCIVKWRANICLIERMQQLINWPLIELSFTLCFPPFLSLLLPSCLSLLVLLPHACIVSSLLIALSLLSMANNKIYAWQATTEGSTSFAFAFASVTAAACIETMKVDDNAPRASPLFPPPSHPPRLSLSHQCLV